MARASDILKDGLPPIAGDVSDGDEPPVEATGDGHDPVDCDPAEIASKLPPPMAEGYLEGWAELISAPKGFLAKVFAIHFGFARYYRNILALFVEASREVDTRVISLRQQLDACYAAVERQAKLIDDHGKAAVAAIKAGSTAQINVDTQLRTDLKACTAGLAKLQNQQVGVPISSTAPTSQTSNHQLAEAIKKLTLEIQSKQKPVGTTAWPITAILAALVVGGVIGVMLKTVIDHQ